MIESFGLAVLLGLVLVMLYFAGRVAYELTGNWLRALRAQSRPSTPHEQSRNP